MLSARLAEIVDALPLRPGLRVLEVGCGTGAAARAVAALIGDGHVLAIDRSRTVLEQAVRVSSTEIESGTLSYRCCAVEDFELHPGEPPYDLVFAVRVGALFKTFTPFGIGLAAKFNAFKIAFGYFGYVYIEQSMGR